MWRWPSTPTIPASFNVFCRLSRKVSTSSCPVLNHANTTSRVLLSTIKSNAEHPCPRCLVKKVDTIKMGMHADMINRHANVRVDDHVRQITVKRARQLVFEQGISLNSKHLKNILGKFSGVPTIVSHTDSRTSNYIDMLLSRTPSHRSSVLLALSITPYSQSTYFTSSSLVYGKRSSHT